MILGTGIDIVEIQRFARWHLYSKTQLLKLFSVEEIEYCLANPTKSAERFAVRFAAREAFYKALCVTHSHCTVPFFLICKAVKIEKKGHIPFFQVDRQLLQQKCAEMPVFQVLCSLSHSKTYAVAQVIVEKTIQTSLG